jgi:hypothetical protein
VAPHSVPQVLNVPSTGPPNPPATTFTLHHLSRHLLGIAVPVITAGLLLSGCQSESLDPDLASRSKHRDLIVEGTGNGSGKVTSPEVLEVGPLNCAIARGTHDPAACSKKHAYKSTVVLTAPADPGSTFEGGSGACTGANATCGLVMTQ